MDLETKQKWNEKLGKALHRLAEFMGWTFDDRVYLFQKTMPDGNTISFEFQMGGVMDHTGETPVLLKEADDGLMEVMIKITVGYVHSVLKKKEDDYREQS